MGLPLGPNGMTDEPQRQRNKGSTALRISLKRNTIAYSIANRFGQREAGKNAKGTQNAVPQHLTEIAQNARILSQRLFFFKYSKFGDLFVGYFHHSF
ncbi:hypothetical protein HMPREF1870_01247 [Bacteroidales bacterium KA00344]|nr:hypothetical protein HMPREF1870_01247 [Bacteroidales bacterium KA00344]